MRTNYTVIVVGAGFAGIEAATRLSRRGVRVLIIDRNSYHQFQPLLYQVATAQLGVSDVARPIRSITHRRRWVDVIHAEVAAVDAAERTVTTVDGQVFRSRMLVIASGAEANFFDTPGAEEHAFPLYSVNDSIELGGRLIELLETANMGSSGGAVNLVVVGGGPTGVETAGALAETVKYVVPEYFSPELADRCQVILADMAPNLLGAFDEQNQKYAARTLKKVGVDLRLGVGVTAVRPDGIDLADNSAISSELVVWAGGLKAGKIIGSSGLPQGRGGRVDVKPDLTVEGFPGVYVLGDAANMTDAHGNHLPQLGSVAKQAGAWAARNIVAELAGKDPAPFRYVDKGFMAMVGRGAAVAEFGRQRIRVQGFIAFLAWLAVHVALLSGFWQRARALLNWIQNYLSHDRSHVFLGSRRQ
jgi:NADH dehydrogenase